MLPILGDFEVLRPTTTHEAVRMRREHPCAMFSAGGTDLVPNFRYGLYAPTHVILLSGIQTLRGIRIDGTWIHVGAMTTLAEVATHPDLLADATALALAAGAAAGPQLRHRGTIGGNLALDTRCEWYNHDAHWRKALGGCLKLDGDRCHVTGQRAGCVAANSGDTVPALMALGAKVEVLRAQGETEFVSVDDVIGRQGFFGPALGLERRRAHLNLETGDMILGVSVPRVTRETRFSTFRKVALRASISFSQLNVAVAASFFREQCASLAIVISAILPSPRMIRGLEAFQGHVLDDATIEVIGQHAFAQTRPQSNVPGDPVWRREMARVEVMRALHDLRRQNERRHCHRT